MSVKAKYIKDLPLKNELDGSESLLVQDLNGTQQAPLEVIVDEIKQNSQEKIREIESELNQTNAQLSQINYKKANADDVRMKNVKITENDISDTLKSQMAGNTPIGNTPNDRSIDWTKTNFMSSVNLFDENNIVLGHYINEANGTMVPNSGYNCTNFVRIEPQTYYYSNIPTNNHEALYDEEKNYISPTTVTDGKFYSGNAHYVRSSFGSSADLSQLILSKENPATMNGRYVPFNPQIDKNFIPNIDTEDIPVFYDKVKGFEKLNIIKTSNLVDKSKLTKGYLSGPAIISNHNSYCVTDYIKLEANKNYYVKGNIRSTLESGQIYDINGKFLEYKSISSNMVLNFREDCFIRFTVIDSTSDVALYEGDKDLGYPEYKFMINEDNLPKSKVAFSDLDFVVSTNLFNRNDEDVVLNKYLDGTWKGDNPSYFISGYISVEPNTDYIVTFYRFMSFFNENKVLISSLNSQGTGFTTPDGCYYIRFTGRMSELEEVMLNIGTKLLPYEPYQIKIPSEYLDVASTDAPDICLPETLYVLRGRTIEIYFDQILLCQNIDDYIFRATCKNSNGNSIGILYKNKFSIPTTQATALGDYTLTLVLYSNLKSVSEKSITVKIVDKGSVNAIQEIISFGDSLVNKPWLKETRDIINELYGKDILHFTGSLDYATHLSATDEERAFLKNEGRSGWTQEYYTCEGAKFTQLQFKVNNIHIMPSPKKVYYVPYNNNPTGMQYEFEEAYDINGDVTTNPSEVTHMLFNQYVNSWDKPDGQATGGVMISVNDSVTGDTTIAYESYTTPNGNPFWNPNTESVDFNYYFDKNNINEPNAFVMLLGMNNIKDTDSILSLVNSIQSQMTNKKVFIMLPHYKGDYYYNPDEKTSFFKFAKTIIEETKNISNCFIVPLYACHDSKHNMGWKEESVNPRNNNYKIKVATDIVHPQECGYFQFGDILSSALIGELYS